MDTKSFQKLSKSELACPILYYAKPVETAFYQDITVSELIHSLKEKKLNHFTSYFYVIDRSEKLCGVLSTRDILFKDLNTKLCDIMKRNVIKVLSSQPLKMAIDLILRHELLALPVVQNDDKLCGIIEFDCFVENDIKSEFLKGTSKGSNIFQLIGLSIQQIELTSTSSEFRQRMPWLFCNLFAGLACALIAKTYHLLLDDVIVISMFIPLVLTLGESVSVQSMALSLYFLKYKTITWRQVLSRLSIEWKTGLLLGIGCSLPVCAVYLFFYSGYIPMFAIALSIIISVAFVTTFGTLLPIILHFFNLDPKIASGPLVLMLTDISVTTIYLGLSHKLLIGV